MQETGDPISFVEVQLHVEPRGEVGVDNYAVSHHGGHKTVQNARMESRIGGTKATAYQNRGSTEKLWAEQS